MSKRTRTSREQSFARGLALTLSAAVTLASLGLAAGALAAAPTLSDEEFESAEFIYFDRCSGCHGTLRKGATGPAINDEQMLKQKLAKLEETIFNGTEAGMPGWGRMGELNRDQAKLMSKFLQLPAPIPPEMGLKEMKASWKVKVPRSKMIWLRRSSPSNSTCRRSGRRTATFATPPYWIIAPES